MARRWTAGEMATLRACLARGLTDEQIGQRLDRSPGGIGERRRQLGYSRSSHGPRAGKPWTEHEIAYLEHAAERRIQHVEIAKRLGRTVAAVRCRLDLLKHGPRLHRYDHTARPPLPDWPTAPKGLGHRCLDDPTLHLGGHVSW